MMTKQVQPQLTELMACQGRKTNASQQANAMKRAKNTASTWETDFTQYLGSQESFLEEGTFNLKEFPR